MKTTNCIFVLVLLLCSALSLRKEKDYKSFMNLYNSNNYLRKGALVEAKAMILPKGVIDPDFIQKKEKAMRLPKEIWCDDFVQEKEKAFKIPDAINVHDFVQKKEKLFRYTPGLKPSFAQKKEKAYLHLTKVGKLY